jgi:hypothetical protein
MVIHCVSLTKNYFSQKWVGAEGALCFQPSGSALAWSYETLVLNFICTGSLATLH